MNEASELRGELAGAQAEIKRLMLVNHEAFNQRDAALLQLREAEALMVEADSHLSWMLHRIVLTDKLNKDVDGTLDRLRTYFKKVRETEKRVEPAPNCNHEYVKQPLRGPGSYCVNCNGQWLPGEA